MSTCPSAAQGWATCWWGGWGWCELPGLGLLPHLEQGNPGPSRSWRAAPGPGLWRVGQRGSACAQQPSSSLVRRLVPPPPITRGLSWPVSPLKGRFESPSGVCVLGQPDRGTPGCLRPTRIWAMGLAGALSCSSLQESPAGAGDSLGAARGPTNRGDGSRGSSLVGVRG